MRTAVPASDLAALQRIAQMQRPVSMGAIEGVRAARAFVDWAAALADPPKAQRTCGNPACPGMQADQKLRKCARCQAVS